MFALERNALDRIARALRQQLGATLCLVVVFGSRVRGDFVGDSDLDVLVVVREKSPQMMDQIHEIFEQEEERIGIPFSPVIKTWEAFQKEKTYRTPFYKNVRKEGILIYGAF